MESALGWGLNAGPRVCTVGVPSGVRCGALGLPLRLAMDRPRAVLGVVGEVLHRVLVPPILGPRSLSLFSLEVRSRPLRAAAARRWPARGRTWTLQTWCGSLLSSHSLRSLQRVTGRRDQCLRWFSNTRRLGPWRPVNAELAGLCRSGRPCPWLSLCPVTSCFALTSSLLTAVALSSCVCGGLVTPAPPPGGVSTWELLLGRAGLSHSAPLVIHTCIGGFFF